MAAHYAGVWGARRSMTNYQYNHIGWFAAGGEALCKSLFFGGVPHRFPRLKFAFLEGGVGWACSLYADLVAHWKKRNARAIGQYDPSRVEPTVLRDLFSKFGGKVALPDVDPVGNIAWLEAWKRDCPRPFEDFARCGVELEENIRDLFVEYFYFGCEAVDRTAAWAYNRRINPYGARLKALYSSDVGHWDVPDMQNVVHEARELLEEELLTESEFEKNRGSSSHEARPPSERRIPRTPTPSTSNT